MKPPEGEIIKLAGLYHVVNRPNLLELSWQWDEPDAKETKVKVEFGEWL